MVQEQNPLRTELLQQRDKLSKKIHNPTSLIRLDPLTYLERARIHASLGYPDLAAGDAYRALLLTDEVLDESSQYHEDAVTAILHTSHRWVSGTKHGAATENRTGHEKRAHDDDGNEIAIDNRQLMFAHGLAQNLASQAYHDLIKALQDCGDFRTAYEFCMRAIRASPENHILLDASKQASNDLLDKQKSKDPNFASDGFDPLLDLPEQGMVRREVYPWNDHEPDRCDEEDLQNINTRLKDIAPSCEVRAVALPTLGCSENDSRRDQDTNVQLGLFAIEELPARSTILREPSLVAASLRASAPLCDACTSPLPNALSPGAGAHGGPILCEDCPEDDILFCTIACREAAQASYHSTICGVPEYDLLAKDPQDPVDASHNLYFLLLARILAMSVAQDTHPLDLPSIKYLWGDFQEPPTDAASPQENPSRPGTLPFSFRHNILYPIHLLTQLDLPPWDTTRFDTWVVNTLYAKLRGVASARMGRDGKPEAAAVHPMWCLANHSCAPNVKWDFGGEVPGREMRMLVREKGERINWGSEERRYEKGEEGTGIKAGEQIFNHYCDVGLPVKERREWARGALGGACVCERCVWEAGRGEKAERERDQRSNGQEQVE